jgi:hypothetical protein
MPPLLILDIPTNPHTHPHRFWRLPRKRKTPLPENGKLFEAVVMEIARPSGMSGLEATIAIKQIDAEAIHS